MVIAAPGGPDHSVIVRVERRPGGMSVADGERQTVASCPAASRFFTHALTQGRPLVASMR